MADHRVDGPARRAPTTISASHFAFVELPRRVEALLRRSQQPAQRDRAPGGWATSSLDLLARRAERAGKVLDLLPSANSRSSNA
jgi:DNA-binding response OmpR family regulator